MGEMSPDKTPKADERCDNVHKSGEVLGGYARDASEYE